MSSEPMNAAPSPAPVPPLAAPAAEPAPRRRGVPRDVLAAWLLAAVAIVISVLLWQKLEGMQQQLARQSADAGNNAVEARALARQAEETARDAAAKAALLDTRIGEMSAYRAQLEDLVQTFTRARDENLAIDLETALRVAQDQTQLTGSVEPLLAALRTAERRLGRSADPRLVPVARAVAKDLERVKTASLPDTAGLLARIDQLLRQVDDLPLANDVGRARSEPAPGERAAQPPGSWWARWRDVLLAEARDLLRVSRIDRPEATLLSPEQAFFVRENLKLRLQGARLGLLARQYEAARADLSAAQTALGAWFDPASRRTQAAAALLQQIQGLTKAAELPRVQDTLAALGAASAVDAPAGSK